MKNSSQSGIAHIGLLLLILVAAAIGFVGYKLEQSRKDNSPTASTTSVAQTAQTIPAISSKADLSTAQAALNSQNVDGDLNPGSFDSDVSSLQ